MVEEEDEEEETKIMKEERPNIYIGGNEIQNDVSILLDT